MPCHELYTCDSATSICVELPGDQEACSLPIDVAAPTLLEWAELIDEAAQAGRLDPDEYGIAGKYCIQDGTTSGTGRCGPLPYLGEACGLGSQCQAGHFCDGGRCVQSCSVGGGEF